MKKTKKNYTAPHIDIIDQAPGNIMGAQFSIIEDDPVVEDVYDMLVEIGVYEADEEPGFADKALNAVLKGTNDIIYLIFGAKGFLD